MLSEYLEGEYAVELLADDASGVGYLLKDRVYDMDHFADAVRRVGEGGSAQASASSRDGQAEVRDLPGGSVGDLGEQEDPGGSGSKWGWPSKCSRPR